MTREPKTPQRFTELPRDKPMGERTEHANLDRPGAQAHPVARGWTHFANPAAGWKR